MYGMSGKNILYIKKEISALSSADIKLIAVSKKKPADLILEVIKENHYIFGENQVQEAEQKWIEIKKMYPQIELHMLGPIQTNKVKKAVRIFDVIQSLSGEKLAIKLKDAMVEEGRNLPCLIQVNIGKEKQKSGVMPEELDDYYNFCTKELAISVIGLMAIPPLGEIQRENYIWMESKKTLYDLPYLSMGMSNDYLEAIKFGSNMVRIGEKIFGKRLITT